MAAAAGTIPAQADDMSARTEHAQSKRKFSGSAITNGHVSSPSAVKQQDILEVLRQHDTLSSFLEHEFTEQTHVEPSSKRVKLSTSNTTQTCIAAKLEQSRYSVLDDLVKDADRVCEEIVTGVRRKDQTQDTQRPTVDDLKAIQRAKAIRESVRALVAREVTLETGQELKAEIKEEPAAQVALKREHEDAGTVLTLFGNAPTPKQLFSSFQNATSATEGVPATAGLLIEEMSLPNGLSATRIRPSTTTASEKTSTFADSFAPPQSLPQLAAPKAYKRPSTRDNTVTWEFKDNIRGNKRGGYTTQPLTVADWLSYGGTSLSPRERRKQRERALSGSAGDEQTTLEALNTASEFDKQEEALFHQAYSSFAPAYDNSRALVDASLKSMVWWHKIGNKRFEARFNLDPALRDEEVSEQTSTSAVDLADNDSAVEDIDFAKAVEEYEPDDEPAEDVAQDMTDVDNVLNRINALLQTLASHQHIRNATVPTTALAPKTPISPAPALSTRSGKPDVPSEEERSTYEDLKREIAYLVLQLPPYAVTKLNGDQLAELGVSKVITFESSKYRGQLEEDQAARLARYTAAATAAGIASLTRSSSNTNPHYSSSSRTPAIGQLANTRYGQSTYSGRTPSSGPVAQRPVSGQASYATPTAQSRSQYNQPSQFARSATTLQQYGQTNGQSVYQQRPGTSSSSVYSSSVRPGYGQSIPPAQPRSQMAAANAVAYQTSAANNAAQNSSPVKTVTQQPASGRVTPVAYASPAHTPVNGLQNARAPPPLIARAASGTPQPQAQAPAAAAMSNGHA